MLSLNPSMPPAGHRPWPLPRSPWIMFMRWCNLAFFHWPVDVAALQRIMPPELPVDTFEGQAWLGITPLKMTNTRPRCLPPMPWVSTFPELNVRTYVTIGGKPGIWFLSLDAANTVAVRAARLGYKLPYYDARMVIEREEDGFHYQSQRRTRRGLQAEFVARYRPCGNVYQAQPGTLDYFLTERYCLYVVSKGRILRGEIHHQPWLLQAAEGSVRTNTMAAAGGLALSLQPPLVHYAERQDVFAWYLKPVN
jgi:uncharacterized protein